ncbi:putative baseplate assembly protein [Massilia sp. TSP1-1-2]|uniref:putative baseplate assembly protein n=1 Tax=Massilia sp. TSP1-1-2 TaxID=2804649 RepID=UPI003CEDCB14
MKRQFRSAHPHRVQLLRELNPPTLNGIDYLEIGSADQRTLKVVFVHPVAGLAAAHFRVEGGVRIVGVKLDGPVLVAGREVSVRVDRTGDFSSYTLLLQNPAAPLEAPAGFDPCLSNIAFSFKAECPSDFDCLTARTCAPPVYVEPRLDYLAKDYTSFRRLMLERMGQLMPLSRERNPADFSVALVEMLAHVGDQLSYYQDAVATEAYLGTARQRVSLRRHARLLDYAINDGCNSRVWVALSVLLAADGRVLPASTPVLTRGAAGGGAIERAAILHTLPDPQVQVFETMHELTLQSAHNGIGIHAWGDPNFCLARGSTSAALVDGAGLSLKAGDVLVLEEVANPGTGLAADADRSHRHAVRLLAVEAGVDPMGAVDPVTHAALPVALQLVRWHADDALPFALCVTVERPLGGGLQTLQLARARGNVVLADHGFTRDRVGLLPPLAPAGSRYRPRLPDTGLAFAQPYRHRAALGQSARAALSQDLQQVQPAGMYLELDGAAAAPRWNARADLLGSDRFAQEFVVETEHDGSAHLRFGDRQFGMAPEPQARLLAHYRVGGGGEGNVGAESLTRIVSEDPVLRLAIVGVRNPLAAVGGVDPEPADAIKLLAPEAFRVQERAVTEDDYARVAERHPEVQRALARLRWTGSWYTMVVIVDRLGGKPLDAAFRAAMLEHLERFRLAGHDLDLAAPVFVALDIALLVCVAPGFFSAPVEKALYQALGAGRDANGQAGFFHPDHFTFGDPLSVSRLIAAAMQVSGVASIEVLRFQRWGKPADHEIENARIQAAPLEVLRLDNDPSFPENGHLMLTMCGGI